MQRTFASYCLVLAATLAASLAVGEPLQVALFRADVTPPAGAPLCDALCPPSTGVNDPLSARGIIFLSQDQSPIVLVAVDWVGIGNDGNHAWRKALADACSTTIDRVCVHTLHQHDAPGCDFQAEEIAAGADLAGRLFPVGFAREAIDRAAAAAKKSLAERSVVSHISYGSGAVSNVASNRRILGDDGKVKYMRLTACTDPVIRDQPVGLIDPLVRMVAFWNEDQPLAILTYYATHPQSYYRTGLVSADFVGMARDMAQRAEGAKLHIHFNGAGGNIG
ncbi:MAG: hypothetical protein KDA37_13175, partial [Planctomycetales bacterium]|nr:hypothetical protein [Planctomycetales bacterium]